MKKVKEGYKMTELGEIPEEWRLETMKNIIVSTQLGTNTLGKEGVINGIPMLKMGNLTIGGFNFDKVEYIESEELEDNKEYILNNGDFLFNTRNTLELVGKSATWNNQLPVAIFNSNIMRIKYKSNIDDFYMSYYFEDSAGWKHLKAIATGTTSVAAVYTKDLMKVKVKLPTLKEQQKISLILISVDKQIEITDNLIEKTKELKKGLMQKLLTKGIGHSRFKDTEIGRIPEEWDIKRFKDVSKVSQGLQIAIENRFKEPGANRLPYITIQYLNDKTNYDNQYYVENANKSVICSLDDILMTRTGNTGVVITNENGVFHNNFFKVDYDRSILYKDFLVYYLKSELIQSIIVRYAGTTTIPDLKHGDFYKIPVALPPIAEQKKIAYILLSADEQIDQYESKKEKFQELKKGLMQKLLTGNIRVKV